MGSAGPAAVGECRCEDVCGSANSTAWSAARTGDEHLAAQTAALAPALEPGGSGSGSAGSGGGGGTAAPATDWRLSPHVNQEALAGYQPSLSTREMDRAIYSMGDPSRLRRVAAKLLAGQPVNIVFLGGSLTV